VRGFVFQNINNDLNGDQDVYAAVRGGTGWRVEDCKVRNIKAAGLDIRGSGWNTMASDIIVTRTVIEDIGAKGMSACYVNGGLFKDCILRRINEDYHDPGNDTGGLKFLEDKNITVDSMVVYDTNGVGIWFDGYNRFINIINCTAFANHTTDEYDGTDGMGIMFEISAGPAFINNNLVHSTTGAGIQNAESGYEAAVTITNNILINNNVSVDLRCDFREEDIDPETGVICEIGETVIKNNIFKDWKAMAWGNNMSADTLRGKGLPRTAGIDIDSNTYDGSGKQYVLWLWEDFDSHVRASSFKQIQEGLKCDLNGSETKGIDLGVDIYDVSMNIKWQVTNAAEAENKTIDTAVDGKRVNDSAVIPVYRRGRFKETADGIWQCEVFDLQARAFTLCDMTEKDKSLLENAVSIWVKKMKPVYLNVNIKSLDEYDFLGIMI
jgi:hypothetical protein